ncbi:MAG: hypothetical protein WHV26_12095 [Spirochaetota bacterium]
MRNFASISTFVIAIVVFASSCATLNTQDTKLVDQLKAENRVCSQNLNLFMRENDVLKAENAKYKKENVNLQSRNNLLQSDLNALQTKYNNDIAMWNQRYNSLQQKYDVFVKQSDVKLQELDQRNKELEKKMADEIARLNEVIRKQEVDFIKEKENIVNQNAKKEIECQTTIDSLQKQVASLSSEKEQLKSRLAEAEVLIQKMQKELDDMKKASVTEINKAEDTGTETTKDEQKKEESK